MGECSALEAPSRREDAGRCRRMLVKEMRGDGEEEEKGGDGEHGHHLDPVLDVHFVDGPMDGRGDGWIRWLLSSMKNTWR